MNYLIGIDGGGTKTDCLLTDETYKQVYSVRGGPLNLLQSGISGSVVTISNLIDTALSDTGINLAEVSCIGIGAAGAGRAEDATAFEKELREYFHSSIIIKVISDAEAALEGAFSGRQGAILISGTGSIIYGKDETGNIHRCGGYGKIPGDKGSGYMIGLKGLTAVIKNYDGIGKGTLITSLLKEKYKLETFDGIISSVYKNNFDIAGAAPLILIAADKEDTTAIQILEEETDGLMELISGMRHKLKTETFEIAFIGGLICEHNIYSDMLRKKINDAFTGIVIKYPEYPPAIGAIMAASKKLPK
jgi:N-acetylglucosamine kinase-like BadF-type ATPase